MSDYTINSYFIYFDYEGYRQYIGSVSKGTHSWEDSAITEHGTLIVTLENGATVFYHNVSYIEIDCRYETDHGTITNYVVTIQSHVPYLSDIPF